MDKMLYIERATLQLGGRLLFRNLSLEVRPGEWVCLTGDSGCGKTSLLRAVLGFHELDGGRVVVDGKRLSAQTIEFIRKKTTYLPQNFFLPAETVEEMLRIPFSLKANRDRNFSKERLFPLWNLLGLEHGLLERKVNQLSGGQRQRVVLSMAAMLGKELLLADEPTSALDADTLVRVVALFRKMKESGMTILSTSHNAAFIQACDRVVRM